MFSKKIHSNCASRFVRENATVCCNVKAFYVKAFKLKWYKIKPHTGGNCFKVNLPLRNVSDNIRLLFHYERRMAKHSDFKDYVFRI